MLKKKTENKEVLGKVSVPKGMFAYVKDGTVFGFKPKRRSRKER